MNNKDLCKTLQKQVPNDFKALCESNQEFSNTIEFTDTGVGFQGSSENAWFYVNLADKEYPLNYNIAFNLKDLQGILFGYYKLDDMPGMKDTRICTNAEMLCRLRIMSAITKVYKYIRAAIMREKGTTLKLKSISKKLGKPANPLNAVIDLDGEGEVLLKGYTGA